MWQGLTIKAESRSPGPSEKCGSSEFSVTPPPAWTSAWCVTGSETVPMAPTRAGSARPPPAARGSVSTAAPSPHTACEWFLTLCSGGWRRCGERRSSSAGLSAPYASLPRGSCPEPPPTCPCLRLSAESCLAPSPPGSLPPRSRNS